MRTWADVAVLARTKNLKGGFVARSAAGLPFLLHEGLEVAFVPPVHDSLRRASVASCEQQVDGDWLVFFNGVTDRDMAERLAGCHCLVRRDDLPTDVFAEAPCNLMGWEVSDVAAGLLGTVQEVVDNPGQSLLSVCRNNGRALLIPLVDEFVVSLDERARHIVVSVPSGLLDL